MFIMKPPVKADYMLFVNSQSGSAGLKYDQVRRVLIEKGVSLLESHSVDRPAELPQVVLRAILAGHRFIMSLFHLPSCLK